MPVKLYYNIASPPSRAVLLTLKLLNIPHELHFTDVTKEEHKTEEFLKINPQHKLPTIVDDDGFIVQDSHAINAYLVGKYGMDDKLYLKDIKARSVIDHRLHFDTGVLWQAFVFVNLYVPIEKEKYPLLTGYIERCHTNIPFCGEMNKKGIQAFRVYLNNVNFQLSSQ